jgi:uncharacterized protein YjaG (DUF416 family)
MSDLIINNQLKSLEQEIVRLEQREAITFAASCCQRQVSVYEKSSAGKDWSNLPLVEKVIGYAWEYLIQSKGIPDNLNNELNAALPSQPYGNIDNASINCISSLEMLVDMILKNMSGYALDISNSSLDILDTLLYCNLDLQVTPENDIIVYSNELIQKEINRQSSDILRLNKEEYPDVIMSIYREVVGVDLTNGIWYT